MYMTVPYHLNGPSRSRFRLRNTLAKLVSVRSPTANEPVFFLSHRPTAQSLRWRDAVQDRKTTHFAQNVWYDERRPIRMTTAAPPTVTNSGEDVILSTIDIVPEIIAQDSSLEESYEIESTLKEIERGGYSRVSIPLFPVASTETKYSGNYRLDYNSLMNYCTTRLQSSEQYEID
jgi:hypothetical protein